MVICCVVDCKNRSDNTSQDISFHRIPKVIIHQDEETKLLSKARREKWFQVIKREDVNVDASYYRVCSQHFINGKPAKLFESSHPDWVPNKNLGYHTHTSTNTSRFERSNKRKVQLVSSSSSIGSGSECKVLVEGASSILQSIPEVEISPNTNLPEEIDQVTELMFSLSLSTQTDLTAETIGAMEDQLVETNAELYKLKQELSLVKVGTIEWFSNDAKVKFYTGLPNIKVLSALFNYIQCEIAGGTKTVLTKFQKLVMTLMRMRLNLTLLDLAYRLNVSSSTTSSVFLEMIDVLFVYLKSLIMWPNREQLIKTTPMSFRKHFGTKICIIIDCFEVFINKPKNVLARAQTFSNYKHHNTVKFLIGIAPQGVISFISKAWGGRASDKFVTENCNILNNLLPGDIVLADRGFDIGESTALYCASVKFPAFTKGKRQLDPSDVEETRRIASVRIHVERVIGNVRNKYTILQDILPLDYLMRKDASNCTTIDKITMVACSLTNLCNSVIPID